MGSLQKQCARAGFFQASTAGATRVLSRQELLTAEQFPLRESSLLQQVTVRDGVLPLQVELVSPGSLGSDCDRPFHVRMLAAVVGVRSRCAKRHLEGAILWHGTSARKDALGITHQRVCLVGRVDPHHGRSRFDRDTRRGEEVCISACSVLLRHLHRHHGAWRRRRA
jgi:hypothetical protein